MTGTLDEMAARYYTALVVGSPALAYLSGRGISPSVVGYFRLGMVDGSYLEHADYTGRISIPYVTKLGGVVGFKFRVAHDCDDTHGHSKYITPYESRIYNPLAFEQAERLGYIGICEGEIDAMILTEECGIPSVAIPGVDTWKKHPEWPLLFDGFPKVYMFKDNDEDRVVPDGKGGTKIVNPGRDLANRIKNDLDNVMIVSLPGKDVNSTFQEHGADLIRAAAGL